jgi:hypothetical protein
MMIDPGHLQASAKYIQQSKKTNHPNKNRLSEASNDSIQDTLIGLQAKRTTMCFSLLKIENFSHNFYAVDRDDNLVSFRKI